MTTAAQKTIREENMTRDGHICEILGLVGWHKDEETYSFTDLQTIGLVPDKFVMQLRLNEWAACLVKCLTSLE